jgi:hypothetical protein
VEDRECPNGWSNCEDCLKLKDCISGLYHGEIAEIEKRMAKEAADSAREIMGMQEENDFWGWWGKSSPPNLHHKEPYKCMAGPTAPGGSGVKNCKKEKKGTKPTIYKWGSIL